MKCSDLEEHIVDYVDGKISKRLRHELDEHIKECTECKNILIQERAVRERLRTTSNGMPKTC